MERERALEIVKKHYSPDGVDDTLRRALETLIPELRESEDDRMFNRVIESLVCFRGKVMAEGDEELAKLVDKEIQWMLKCKESLHITETRKENPDSFTNAVKDVIVAIEKYLDWLTGYPDYAPKGKYSLRDMLHCLFILEKQKEPENTSASTMIPSCWEEEQKVQSNDLDTEIKRFFDDYIEVHEAEIYSRKERVIEVGNYEIIARHFAQWGEKQKEQKPVTKFKVGDKIHLIDGTSPNYEDDCITIREIGTINYIGEFKEGYVPIKEQNKWELVKEQKPIEYLSEDRVYAIMKKLIHLSFSPLFSGDSDEYKTINEITHDVRDLLDYPIEPKTAARSIEDDHIIGFVYDLLNELEWKDEWAMSKSECLQRLNDYRPQQKPVEWSEEDERMKDNILRVLSCFVANVECDSNPSLSTSYPEFQREMDWLKSLRPQPHWKPSEEQMEALDKAIPVCMGVVGRDAVAPLQSLYEHLKKL